MARNGRHDEAISPLGRYWDAQVQRRSVDATDVDPALAATVRHLHVHDDALGADRQFADRLLEDLMQTATAQTSVPLPKNPARLQALDAPVAPRSLPQLSSSRPHWALTQLATGALVLLTLVGSFLAFGPGRPGQSPSAPAFIPAFSVTPATAETDGVATTPLLDVTIPAISGDAAYVAIERYTVPAATTLHADLRRGRVPAVFFMEEGALQIRAISVPDPVRVIRAGGVASEEAIATGESTALAAGDAVIVPEDGNVDLMNMAPERALALYLLEPANVFPAGDPTVSLETLGGNVRNLTAPLILSLRRFTLAPQTSLPGADAPDVEQIAIPVDPDRVMDARSSSDGALRNAGDEPLEAYVLTVTSRAAGS